MLSETRIGEVPILIITGKKGKIDAFIAKASSETFADFAEHLILKKKAHEGEETVYSSIRINDCSTDRIFEREMKVLKQKQDDVDEWFNKLVMERIIAQLDEHTNFPNDDYFSEEERYFDGKTNSINYDINIARRQLHKRLKSVGIYPTYEIIGNTTEALDYIVEELKTLYNVEDNKQATR